MEIKKPYRNAIWRRSLFNIAQFFALVFFCTICVSARAQSWEREWANLIEAAKREGSLVMSAPAGSVWRTQLTKFQTAYPTIKLDITAIAGRDYWARVEKEREAGQFLWDLRIGGLDTIAYRLKTKGYAAELRSQLLLPEVTDEANWRGGLDGLFLDVEHKYFAAFCMYDSPFGYYNSKLVAPSEITTMEDLLKPSLKGKMSLQDPRGGAGLVNMGVAYRRLGEQYVQQLVAEQIATVTNDPRQQLEWALSGRYPVALGLPSAILVDYQNRGVSLELEKITGLKEWTAGVCSAQMISNAPHPNAAKLFVNWLLTRNVQTELTAAVQLNSRRTDVPPGAPDRIVPEDQMSEYVGDQNEEAMQYQEKVLPLLKQFIK